MLKTAFIQSPLFPYRWALDGGRGFPAKNIPHHGAKVFSCFSGGGGSSMGYKLAGYDVVGCNEIDKKQMAVYQNNLGTTPFQYMEDIRLLHQKKLPKELHDLDILDGSPPCTTFSMSGGREKTWGVEKQFSEGQCKQVLDDLAFEFLKLADKLKPKIIVIENVEGLMFGNAISYYATKIKAILADIGYACMHKVLNAADMGLPQTRRRVFFIGVRKDLMRYILTHGLLVNMPTIKLNFRCRHIPFAEVDQGDIQQRMLGLQTKLYDLWAKTKPDNVSFATVTGGSFFNNKKLSMKQPALTLSASCCLYHPLYPRRLSDKEMILISSFPLDYDFKGTDKAFVLGMSVPPIMIANIAWQIKLQWLDVIRERNKK